MLFIIKKLSRRLFVFAALLFCAICFLVLIFQNVLVNYDLQAMTQWHNKNLQVSDWKNDTKTLRYLIEKYNHEQHILNQAKYWPLQNDSIVIVVQVHKRISYLRHLIMSLADARDISKTLLIFSHDFFDRDINQLVQSIDFCPVMQIFYPYSIQTHPNSFPGTDPMDCDRDMKKDEAIQKRCKNAYFQDNFGHYREAKFSQMKHHWWWKLNRVFDELNATKFQSNLLMLLLEEDYVLAPDFFHLLKQLNSLSLKRCSSCNMLSLGTYAESITNENYNKVEISPWLTSKHNMGMAFNRTTWQKIKSCAKFFCSYDDYNYDWSLQNVNYNCLKEKLTVMYIKSPRIYHIGECGMHHNSVDCDSSQAILKVQNVIDNATNMNKLFPKKLKITKVLNEYDVSDNLKPWGGWSDIRDQVLCLNMTTLY